MSNRATSRGSTNYDPRLRVLIGVVVVGLTIYAAWHRPREPKPLERPTVQTPTEPAKAPSTEPNNLGPSALIAGQTIRDQDGRIVFRGDVDVGPTLNRIRRDERLPFSHDGNVFQNRERRLPQKPAGYYHEFVHPTPGLSGPGPQRIIVGREGETYYTPDHYRTFKRVDE